METKKALLDICIEKQEEAINELQLAIDDAQKQSNDYGAPKDRYDAFRTKLMRQRDMFAQQMAKANVLLTTLNQIDLNEPKNKVEFGAIVITNKQNIFVSAGIGKIEYNNKIWYAISPQVPVFQAMNGLQKGDSFKFNNNTFEIIDIY